MHVEDDEIERDRGYEEARAVLGDDNERQEEIETHRRSYNDREQISKLSPKFQKDDLLNLNWKGPMPLYPEEVNRMIKQAVMQNYNVRLPVHSRDNKVVDDRPESEKSDSYYVDDNNKYDNLVGLAQAYSDYGVLEGKKDLTTTSDAKTNEGYTLFESLIPSGLRRKKKGFDDFERTMNSGMLNHSNLLSSIQKHVKFISPKDFHDAPDPRMNSEIDKSDNAIEIETQSRSDLTTDKSSFHEKDQYLTYKKNRNLLSVDNFEKIDKDRKTEDKSNSSFAIGEFLGRVADWFFTMANLSGELDTNLTRSNDSIHNNITTNITKELEYPLYDSDMVQNIGHRSRVLMSIEEMNTTSIDAIPELETIDALSTVATNSTKLTSNDTQAETNNTVVKRSADDSIFWNDLYDEDEYGMKVDYLDNVLRGKHSAKNDYKNALMKSRAWMQGKMKDVGNRIRTNIGQKWKTTVSKANAVFTSSRKPQTEESAEMKNIFKVLNANLKKICRDAAQQLIRLMGDLVDIQVQQRTCAKLPPDLRDFLDWLTAPADSKRHVDNIAASQFDFNLVLPSLSENSQVPIDDRTECLGKQNAWSQEIPR
ncbi:unnamed protein product [Leptidea sinapis]|uniref:Uncharacterized protein n=1 Tax=Leptidea sinapis TaxID=189913 RepID=A0A5E4QWP9_9NEOP|nr:unnamed protein product [Leptidea sinapis]